MKLLYFYFLYLHAIFIFNIPINRHNRCVYHKKIANKNIFHIKLYYYFVITNGTSDWFVGEPSGEAILDTASIAAEW